MEAIVEWYNSGLGTWLPKEVFVFLLSMVPVIELRGGLVAASLLNIPLLWANVLCIAGNLIPVPFILLFLKKLFEWMKKHNILVKLVTWLEESAAKKSKGAERGEFIFLWLFVGIPLPGTGAWTGSLVASTIHYDFKKSCIAVTLGVLTAAIIMDIISYGLLGLLFG